MDQIFTELQHTHTEHTKTLQGQISKVLTLREEADKLKGEISVTDGNSGNLPTAQLEGIITEAEQVFLEKVLALNQAVQAEIAFCTEHNLINKTIQPNALMTILLISIGVFLEAGMNSSFLYNAHMVVGPLAALLLSFTISLVNVTTSACAGFFIGRFIKYGSNGNDPDALELKTIRNRAKWQFRVFIGVMAFFILTVGLIRSTESLDQIQHTLTHYNELLLTPEAIFLILLSICIAVFSYHKGRTGFVHPYGDYSTYQQGVINAREDLHQAYADYVEDIEDTCEAVESDAETQNKDQKKSIEKHSKKVTACHQEHNALKQAAHTAQSQFSATIAKLLNTHSVITGKSKTIPDSLLNQFSFTDVTDLDLPEFYQSPNGSYNKAALDKAKTEALKRLSKIFKRALQS